jgi:hypothetical protein
LYLPTQHPWSTTLQKAPAASRLIAATNGS